MMKANYTNVYVVLNGSMKVRDLALSSPKAQRHQTLVGQDAFVHVSALQEIGITHLGENACLECEVSKSEKGLFVEVVNNLVEEGDVQTHKVKIPLPPEAGHCYDLKGRVKWYRKDKGYGFVAGEDGKKDIFIHQTALRRNGINDEEFDKGVIVKMSIRDVDQGREAVEISLDNQANSKKSEVVDDKENYNNQSTDAVSNIEIDDNYDHQAIAASSID